MKKWLDALLVVVVIMMIVITMTLNSATVASNCPPAADPMVTMTAILPTVQGVPIAEEVVVLEINATDCTGQLTAKKKPTATVTRTYRMYAQTAITTKATTRPYHHLKVG